MISGFTIVRNIENLGYPFIESVRSALPICNEFIISEGYSTDRTWEAAQALKKRYPDKIRLRRDRWSEAPDNGAVIARISNLALADCTYDHCLYLQANEVIHEDSLEAIASLPVRFPHSDLVNLPMFNMLGRDMLWLHQNRNRFFRRKPNIHIGGDGFDATYLSRSPWARLRSRWRRRKPPEGVLFPQPVFRYRALYPYNYLTKIQVRRAMAQDESLKNDWDNEWLAANEAVDRSGGDPARFWHEMEAFFKRSIRKSSNLDVRPEQLRVLRNLNDCPALIRDLDTGWEFPFDQSLKSITATVRY